MALQILETFQNLGPYLSSTVDHSLELEANPGKHKKQRRDDGSKGHSKGKGNREQKELMEQQGQYHQVLNLLTRLALRQDQELQALRREDTFLFFSKKTRRREPCRPC